MSKSNALFLRSGQASLVILVFMIVTGSAYVLDVQIGQDATITQMNWHKAWAFVPAPTNPGTLPPDAIQYWAAGNVAHALVSTSSSAPECADAQSGSAHSEVGIEFSAVGTPGQSAEAQITFNFSSAAESVLDGGGTADAILYGPPEEQLYRALCTTYGSPATCNKSFTRNEKLTITMFLEAGQTYHVALHVYAHADICQGIARAYSDVRVNNIQIRFNMPTVSVNGPSGIVLSNPAQDGTFYRFDAIGNPGGGSYEWQVVGGADKIRVVSGVGASHLTIQAVAPSTQMGDVQLNVKYTVNGSTSEALHDITVQKPDGLKIAAGYPIPDKEYTVYKYYVMDQFNGYVQEKGLTVAEVWVPTVVCEHGFGWLRKKYTKQVHTDKFGSFEDELKGPSDGYVKLQQEITVAGWPMPLRCLIFRYGVETSEQGVCEQSCR